MLKNILILIAVVVIGFVGWYMLQDGGNMNEYKMGEDEMISVPENITLEDVDPYEGSGTATREFVDGQFTHTVTAQIGDPAEGKFYEGWLVKNPALGQFFSTGKMEKEGNEYVLNFIANANYLDYPTVIITEETEADGLDGNPEAHVLEGKFE